MEHNDGNASVNKSSSSSSSSIENFSNSENVIESGNYKMNGLILPSGAVHPTKMVNFAKHTNLLNMNSFPNISQTNEQMETQKNDTSLGTGTTQTIMQPQPPKPLSMNNFNLVNDPSKSNLEIFGLQLPRPYKRKPICVHENKIECTSRCDEGAGLKRDKKNEYARNQMRKYREKIKSDPIRYMRYLQTERERNAKRKFRKMEKLIKQGGIENPEEIIKLEKRERNRIYREKCKANPNLPRIRLSTQQKLLKAFIEKCKYEDVTIPEGFVLPEDMLRKMRMIKNECTVKEESLSDTENLIEQDDGITDSDDNSQEDIEESDGEISEDDYNFTTFNRKCGIVNCPSRIMDIDGIKYYPLPPQKDIRDYWIKMIKTHTHQWEVNPNAFICSLHFSPGWFELWSYCERRLLPKAIPTIFPSARQFDVDIPYVEENDFVNPDKFQCYYKWSVDKMREQEGFLKHQRNILENQSEMNFLQKKRLSIIFNEINEFKSKYLFAEDVKTDLESIFEKIRDIPMNFPN